VVWRVVGGRGRAGGAAACPYTTLCRSGLGRVDHLGALAAADLEGLGLVGVEGEHHGLVEAQPALGDQRGKEGDLTLGRGGEACRSEEHTSELQSRENLVCRLLLEKQNT